MKKYQVVISPSVNEQMSEYFMHYAPDDIYYTRDLFKRLLKDISLLKFMPESISFLNRPYLEPNKYRYKLSCQHYRIVYQIVNDIVYVDDIQDIREDDEDLV